MASNYIDKARQLAEHHRRVPDSEIQEIYLFPDPEEKEIRLVEVDPVTIPSREGMIAWHFSPHSIPDIPYALAMAVILPEEVGRLSPPTRWVSWNQAIKLFPEPLKASRRKS